MKKVLRALRVFFGIAFVFLIIQRIINWSKESQLQGKFVTSAQASLLSPNGEVFKSTIIPEMGPKILIFWATWCGPCRVELARVQAMVEKETIPRTSVLAISMMEDPKTVEAAVNERKYTFPVAIDPQGDFSRQFDIHVTPTLVLVKDQKIENITSGISLFLEGKLKSLFKL